MLSQFLKSLQNFFNYHSFLWLIVAVLGFIAVWALIEYVLDRYALCYKLFNMVMFGVTVFLILCITLRYRSEQTYSISMVPFSLLYHSFSDSVVFMSLALNIVMFIPFGLFGCSLFRCTSKRSAIIFILCGVAFSVLIEAAQFLLSIGNTEIDDVICNSLGLAIGFLCYRLHNRYIISKRRK